MPGGERLTIELRAGRPGVGQHRAVITAETIASTFVTPAPDGRTYGAHVGDAPGTVISPAFARYQWDGETGYGGLERSALRSAITVRGASTTLRASTAPAAGLPDDKRRS